jgi:hypothetical protein
MIVQSASLRAMRYFPRMCRSFAAQTTSHPALIPQDAPGSSRLHPPIPARPPPESPAHGGSPRRSRSSRKRHDRPVTPEVAGSSPVAPVLMKCLQRGGSRCPPRHDIFPRGPDRGPNEACKVPANQHFELPDDLRLAVEVIANLVSATAIALASCETLGALGSLASGSHKADPLVHRPVARTGSRTR